MTETNQETHDLTLDEKKEKILLEMHYILSQFDEGKLKENKKSLSKILSEISQIFNTKISSKTIKDYIQLKDSKIDENLLKLAKYL